LITRDRAEIENGVVQLRFSDSDDNVRDISAHDLAQVLEGLLEFSRELSKSGEFGDGPSPQIRVRAPKEGSFVLEALVWVQENPITSAGLGLVGVAASAAAKEMGGAAGKAMSTAIGVGIRKLRDEKPVSSELLESGDVALTWPDQTQSVIRPETWSKLQGMKRPTRKALQKLLAPLGNDADRLEVRDASVNESTEEILSTPPDAVAGPGDYLTASIEPEEEYTRERVFETEATLGTIDFDNSQNWRVITTKEGTRKARIDDRDFLLRLDRGEAIHKNDIFWLKILEVASRNAERTPARNGR